jgi:hypothetical protein
MGERMAKILTFRPAELRRCESASIACERASAQVIVFPGVRYERWGQSEHAEPRSEPATKKRPCEQRRDVLELAE